MKKYLVLIFALFTFCSLAVLAQPKFTEIASKPGAFSRMGFGARGIGMGNVMSAITEGHLVSYYNPALSVFQEKSSFQTSYSFLSLDRSLNFLNFTRRFDIYSSKDTSKENRTPRSTAGLSVGVINAGVGKIDGRDNQGVHTEELSTSENQFFLGLAIRISSKLALGLNAKFYYYSLYEDVSSSGVGLDLGALYSLNEDWKISFVITDLNSKYDWETNSVYGQDGSSTKDKFPLLKKIGLSYKNKEANVLAAVEFENSNAGTNIIRTGIEYNIYENLFIRGGVDKFNLSNTDTPAKPALGFSYFKNFSSLVIGVDYAFMIEQYSSHDRHIVGVNINF